MKMPCTKLRSIVGHIVFIALTFSPVLASYPAESSEAGQESSNPLKELTLEQLGNVEITTVSKEPEQVWKASAAVFVLTSEDIRRSGATSIPEVLRLVPGVDVARIDSDQWAV